MTTSTAHDLKNIGDRVIQVSMFPSIKAFSAHDNHKMHIDCKAPALFSCNHYDQQRSGRNQSLHEPQVRITQTIMDQSDTENKVRLDTPCFT